MTFNIRAFKITQTLGEKKREKKKKKNQVKSNTTYLAGTLAGCDVTLGLRVDVRKDIWLFVSPAVNVV